MFNLQPESFKTRLFYSTTKHEACAKGKKKRKITNANLTFPKKASVSREKLQKDITQTDSDCECEAKLLNKC